MTTDQIIAAFSSVGALAAAVATFGTVREISKQRQASYRPELVISRTHFYADGKGSSGLTDWRRAPKCSGACSIQVTNIGLAAAKNIRVKWLFSVKAAVTDINVRAEKINVAKPFASFNTKEFYGPLEISEKGTNGWRYKSYIVFPTYGKVEQIGVYLLPASVSPQEISFAVLGEYRAIIATYAELGIHEDFPSLNFEFEFDDIGGSTHRVLYSLEFKFGTIGPDTIVGVLEPKRIFKPHKSILRSVAGSLFRRRRNVGKGSTPA